MRYVILIAAVVMQRCLGATCSWSVCAPPLKQLAGFNFGGVQVVLAGPIARKWRSERVGQVVAWLFSATIPAALAPIVAGFGYELTGSFAYSAGSDRNRVDFCRRFG